MHSPGLDARAWEVVGLTEQPSAPSELKSSDGTFNAYVHHASGLVNSTEVTITAALRKQYPQAHITNAPGSGYGQCDLLAFAQDGNADATPDDDPHDPMPATQVRRVFLPPARRLDGAGGSMASNILFGRYKYTWKGRQWLIYCVYCGDGFGYPNFKTYFLLSGDGVTFTDSSIAAGRAMLSCVSK